MRRYMSIALLGAVLVSPTVVNAQSGAENAMQSQIEAVARAHKKERKNEIALERRKEEEALRRRMREEQHEDQWRDLDLEERRLEIERQRMVTKRTDEYIDRDLGMQDAEIEQKRGFGGFMRDLGTGVKGMMQGSGSVPEAQ